MRSSDYFKKTFAQLLRPFKYLNIEHPSKKIIDWIIPFLATTVLFIFILTGKYSGFYNFDKTGLVLGFNSFLHVLPGFYIAALAAISTFGSPVMDCLIKNPTPTITEIREGVVTKIGLTRRRFLSLLFSFLTAQSICLIVFYNVISSININDSYVFAKCLISVFLALYIILFFQIVSVTFFGLFYLGDRIHRD